MQNKSTFIIKTKNVLEILYRSINCFFFIEPQNATVMCKLPEVRGHCRALLPRWRYDPVVEKCLEFKFGGCDGNGNNFMTEKECMNVCAGNGKLPM